MKPFFSLFMVTLLTIWGVSQLSEKLIQTIPAEYFSIKSSQDIIRVLDSTIVFKYNNSTSTWVPDMKTFVISRHWGTNGWPNELIEYFFKENQWQPYYLFAWEYFPNQKIKKQTIKAYNTFLGFFKDTLSFDEYNGYTDQFNDSIYLIHRVGYYNFLTNSFTGGYRETANMLNNTQYHEIIGQTYNPATNNYNQNTYKIVYEYNSNQLLQIKTSLLWNGTTSQYENDARDLYAYYPSGKIKSQIHQYIVSGVWKNSSRTDYTYTSNNFTETMVSFNINSSNEFIPYYKDSFVYSSTGKEIFNFRFIWDDFSNIWIKQSKTTKTYNANDSILSILHESWDGIIWNPMARVTFTYNTQGNLIEYLEEYYISSTWYEVFKVTWQYNSTNKVTEQIFYVGPPLEPNLKETFTYDTYDNLTCKTKFYWNSGTGLWDPNEKTVYYWSDWDANAISENLDAEILVSPNPVQNECLIQSHVPISKIDVYNSLGQVMMSFVTQNALNYTIDMSKLQSGNYFLSLTPEDQSHAKIVRSINKQ